MRAVIRVCSLAVCWLCTLGSVAPSSAQVPAFEGEGAPIPTDVAPFQSRLNRLAEEYRVEPVASGHVFGTTDRETFLFRLGGGPDCSKRKTCVEVLFRNAQDDFPFVTYCAAGLFATGHNYTANGMLLYIFEFVCDQNTKFQIRLSEDSARVESYMKMD
jgi:hypothetical protein